jgi:hypothetical protein
MRATALRMGRDKTLLPSHADASLHGVSICRGKFTILAQLLVGIVAKHSGLHDG